MKQAKVSNKLNMIVNYCKRKCPLVFMPQQKRFLTVCWWNRNLPDNLFTKFELWVCYPVIIISSICLFGLPFNIFVEV